MNAQSRRQHAWPQTYVVVNPIRWTGVIVLTRDMRANPDSNIRCHIEASRIRIGLVLINRRSPVNGDAAQHKSEKERHVHPVTPAHQEMVTFNHEHAWFRQ